MIPTKGWIFLGLNAVRILSIISMILVFSSSILIIVNDIKAVNRFTSVAQQASSSGSNSTSVDDMLNCDYIEGSTVPNQPAGAFWAVLNRLLIIAQVIALTLSELGWPMRFFNAYFPVLGDNFGVGALGVIQCLLGAAVLSHHVDDFALVSAFLLFSIGCLNILVGLIFREKAKSKRALFTWKTRFETNDILPTSISTAPGRVAGFAVKTLHTGSSHASHLTSQLSYSNASYSQHSRKHSNDHTVVGHEHPNGMSEKEAMFGLGARGFGRAAEKEREAAQEEGQGVGMGWGGGKTLLTRPLESVPPYMPRSHSQTRRESGGASAGGASAPPTRKQDEDEDEDQA